MLYRICDYCEKNAVELILENRLELRELGDYGILTTSPDSYFDFWDDSGKREALGSRTIELYNPTVTVVICNECWAKHERGEMVMEIATKPRILEESLRIVESNISGLKADLERCESDLAFSGRKLWVQARSIKDYRETIKYNEALRRVILRRLGKSE